MSLNKRALLTGSALSSRVSQWMARGLIKSIQRGTITIVDGTGGINTAAITEVDRNNCLLLFLGNECSAVQQSDNTFTRLDFASATSVRAIRGANNTTGATTTSFCVIEFVPGVIKSIQNGTTTVDATPKSQAITTVDTAKADVIYQGFSFASSGSSLTVVTRVRLASATTIEWNTQSVNAIGAWTVVELY